MYAMCFPEKSLQQINEAHVDDVTDKKLFSSKMIEDVPLKAFFHIKALMTSSDNQLHNKNEIHEKSVFEPKKLHVRESGNLCVCVCLCDDANVST